MYGMTAYHSARLREAFEAGAKWVAQVDDPGRSKLSMDRGFTQFIATVDDTGCDTTAVRRMEELGRAGITISICCGPCGAAPFRWSVQCLTPAGEEFARPFAAHDFAHAIKIAERELLARGWSA